MFKKAFLKKAILVFSGLVIIVAISTAYKIYSNLEEIEINTVNTIIHEEDGKDIEKRNSMRETLAEEEKPENFYTLLIGLDYRDDMFSLNTDSILVAHIIPQQQSIKLVSLPRDLRVENLRQSTAKINSIFNDGYQHALQEGRKDPSLLSGRKVSMGSMHVPEEYISSGMVVLRETVEKFLDIDIEYTFLVNFQTVTSLVDEIGGIEIDVDRSMQYDDPSDGTHIDLEQGLQILNGEDALNFARFREDNRGPRFYSNDFERGERQQKVISALAHELSSWTNVTKVFNVLDIVSTNFKTDMKRDTMISMINKFHGHMNSDSIISIPFNGYWESPYVKINDVDLEQLIRDFTSL